MHLLVESVCARLGLGAALSAPESGSDAVALGLRLLTPGMLKVITGCRPIVTKGTESGNGGSRRTGVKCVNVFSAFNETPLAQLLLLPDQLSTSQ